MWTSVLDGPTHTALLKLASVAHGSSEPGDVVSFMYEDYFGSGNVEVEVDPETRFIPPLELVRQHISDAIEAKRYRPRYHLCKERVVR